MRILKVEVPQTWKCQRLGADVRRWPDGPRSPASQKLMPDVDLQGSIFHFARPSPFQFNLVALPPL